MALGDWGHHHELQDWEQGGNLRRGTGAEVGLGAPPQAAEPEEDWLTCPHCGKEVAVSQCPIKFGYMICPACDMTLDD